MNIRPQPGDRLEALRRAIQHQTRLLADARDCDLRGLADRRWRRLRQMQTELRALGSGVPIRGLRPRARERGEPRA